MSFLEFVHGQKISMCRSWDIKQNSCIFLCLLLSLGVLTVPRVPCLRCEESGFPSISG